MAVMMGTTTILGSTPVSASGSNTYDGFVCGTGAVAEAEQATQTDAANNYGLVSATEGNILHAWDWKFTDVTKNMKDIAESGYSLVQVSPCQVCESASTNNDWWKLYQPYDYKFGNSLGSADEFKEMCATAKDYGISIVVDVVANHMAGTGQGACGDRKGEVDSWWTNDKFHNTGVKFTGEYDNNREMMVRSNIGMPDIDTGREDVQQRMVNYLESMLDMGAGGFRYDAAKHIGTTSDSGNSRDTFWQTISAAVSAKKPDALVYGEILNGMPVPDEYYVNDGIKVTESQKGWDMKDLVQGGASKVTKKTAFDYTRTVSADKLITWVENHDTYLNHWGSTGLQGHANYMSDAQIMLAWSTVGARADAQALYFARPDGCSNPANPDDNDASNKIDGTLGISTKNFDWKDKKVAAVNKFKNAMADVGETTSVKDGLAIIQRGNKGLVVTNYDSSSKNFEVSGLSGLQDGTYEDASGQNGSFTVSGGKVSGSVKGNSFVVLYDANGTTPATLTPSTTTPASETPTTETPATETPATETPASQTPATQTPVGAASISVSKDNGSFDKAFETSITVKDAEYAYYSNDGAAWTEIKDGKATVKIGEGAENNGDAYALYVKAKGKDGKTVDVTKTYTYTTGSTGTTPVTTGLKVRVKKSVFTNLSSAPYLYLYTDTTPVKEPVGSWPGTQMTEEGDYYVYANETVTDEVLAIFNNNDTWQEPSGGEMAKGYAVTGYMEYDGTTMKTVSNDTPATVSPNAKKANKAPEFTILSTQLPASETPATETPVTEAPVAAIQVSKEDGTSFTTETMEVQINVGEGVNGSYCVDNGPVKTFTGNATAVLGQGKIADSDVTLTVIAGTTTKTFTYKKVFDKELAAGQQASGMVAMGNAVMKIQSLFEIVADAAEVNAAAENDGMYATNPNGQIGKRTSTAITGMTGFSADMLIAQCGAWDVPNAWNGGHENSVADCYGLYAAWDDSNLYVGMEFVNTTDTWSREGDGPLSDGGKMSDIPVVLAINVGNKTAISGKMEAASNDEHVWGLNLEFETRVDHFFIGSAKGSGTPGLFLAKSDGTTSYDPEYCLSYKENGITYTSEDGSISPTIMQLHGSTDVADAYDIEKYEDALTASTPHNRKYDTFFTYTIPLKVLGIDSSYIEENGIGIMGLGTRGSSALDCIPHDPSMVDNTKEAYSKDPSTSMEKEDLDIITVPLAAVGNSNGNGNQGGGEVKTPTPATPVPTGNTPVSSVPASETPASEVPASETPASETPASEVPASETPVTTIPDTTTMIVNFGADKSSPQLQGTALELKAIGYNQTGSSTYEFAVDGEVVQAASAKDTYTWNPVAGGHTIQVTMKDEAGKTVVIKKSYTIESNGTIVQTETPASEVPASETPATDVPASETPATDVPASETPASQVPASETPASIVPAPTSDTGNNNPLESTKPITTTSPTKAPSKIQVLLGFKQASPQKLGTSIGLVANVTGGKAGYKYTFVAELSNGFTQTIAKNTSKNTVTWKPTKTGTYTVTVTVADANGSKVSNSAKYKITAKTVKKKLAITKVTVSKKTVKINKKIKITVKGTASKGTLKFKFVVKKNGQKKATVIKKYNTKKTAYWKPKKAGKYTITVYATDGSKKTVKKNIKVTAKKK